MTLIRNLIQAIHTDTNLLVPVTELSQHAVIAKNTQVQMIESLPEGPFLNFLTNYVKYNMEVRRRPPCVACVACVACYAGRVTLHPNTLL